MNENKKVVTKLDAGIATPIAISKDQAELIASKQEDAYKIINEHRINNEENYVDAIQGNSYIQPTRVDENTVNNFNQVNDFIKVEPKQQTKPITYIIMGAILLVIIIIIIIEISSLKGL